METCLYEGKQICAYDVANVNYALNYELKKEWKIAGANGKLICEECGREVQLRVNDIKKRVPHFSHKITDEKCPFSSDAIRESEEHKKGKMLLYNYLKERYLGTNPIVNYRFPNRRRADLYIEFNNGDKLAIEYQRTELDILDWQERHEEYTKSNINVLWLLSGKEEKLKLKEKQIEITFFQQIMLNELDKVVVYLDVDTSKVVFAKNMRYSDPFVENNDYEKLFIKSYYLTDTLIHTNGKIECGFGEEYKKANQKFTDYYSKRCIEEENNRQLEKEEEQRRRGELFKKKSEEIKYRPRISEVKFESNLENNEIRYCDGNIPYKNRIKYAINGDENAIEVIARHLRKWGNSDDFKVIILIFRYHYLKGNTHGKEIYERVMRKAGFDCESLNLADKALNQIECPFCKGKLIQKYGKYGDFVSCSNYPDCKFSFNI